jgi:hypothetical protein
MGDAPLFMPLPCTEIHHAETSGVMHSYPAQQCLLAEMLQLTFIQLGQFLGDVIMRGEQPRRKKIFEFPVLTFVTALW